MLVVESDFAHGVVLEDVRAAERAWPYVVVPERASAFDMLAAAYAYRTLDLTPARKAQLGGYLGHYGIPVNGAVCITNPRCYNNLKLVDAATVLAITGAGIRAADPAGRLADPRAARAAAARIVNRRVPDVADFALRAFEAGALRRGTVLSDPPSDPTAYHALSAFMLDLAVRELGPEASGAARRARRAALEALALLVSPAGERELPRPRPGPGLGPRDHRRGPRRGRTRLPRAGAALPRCRPRRAPPPGTAPRHAGPRLRRRPRREPPYDDGRDRSLRPYGRLQRPRALRAHRRARRAAPRPRPHARSQAPGRPGARTRRPRRDRPRDRGRRPHVDGRPRHPPQHERPAPRPRPTRARAPRGPPLARPARPAPAH